MLLENSCFQIEFCDNSRGGALFMKELMVVLMLGFGLILESRGGTTNAPDGTSQDKMIQRSFKVEAKKFIENLKHLDRPRAGESDSALLTRYCSERHIQIQKPAAIYVDAANGQVLVRVP